MRDGLLVTARQSSANNHTAAPNNTKSLARNCPGTTDSAGKPPADVSQTPGVVNRKLKVVRNMPTAAKLPASAARPDNGRAAMRRATAISTPPSTAEKPRTLNSE